MKKSESRYFAIADCIKDGINSIKQIAEELEYQEQPFKGIFNI